MMMQYAMNITAMSPLIPKIADTFGMPLSSVGILFTTVFLGFVSFILFGGFAAGRYGTKRVLNIAYIGYTVSVFLFALAPSFITLCIISVFMGGFAGILESLSSAFVGEINPERPDFYINLTQVFFGIGALAPVGVGFIISSGLSWRITYFILAGFSAVTMVIFLLTKDTGNVGRENQGNVEKPRNMVSVLIKDYKFILLFIAMFLYTGSEVGAWGWMSTFLSEKLSFPEVLSATAVAVFWLSMTLGRLVCGALTSKVKSRTIILALAFIASATTFVSAFIQSPTAAWVVIVGMGLGYSSIFPLIVAYGGSRVKAPSSLVISALVAGGGVGSMIIPFLIGVAGDNLGFGAAMILPSVFLLMIAVIFIVLRNKKKNETMKTP